MLRGMRRVVLLSLLASASAVAGPEAPIIGGTPATAGEYPNVVGVVFSGGDGSVALCTGTLITSTWVMTAGHCVTPSEDMVSTQDEVTAGLRIYVGALTIFPPPDGNDGLTVMTSMPDPMFDINALGSHDMGLIQLAQPVTGVTPVKLNFDASAIQPGANVTQVGYGETGTNGTGNAGTLYTVMQSLSSCASIGLGSAEDANLLCYSQTNGKGKCSGDSGGPSFAQIDGETVEVGETSFGDPNCAQYGTDTRIDAEKAFLLANIPSLQTCNSDSDCGAEQECFNHACITTPYSPMGLGSACSSAADCTSADCVATSNEGQLCSMACTAGNDSTCPGGFTCIADGANGACVPGSGGGCCDASGRGAPTAIIGFALVGVVWRRRRKRTS